MSEYPIPTIPPTPEKTLIYVIIGFVANFLLFLYLKYLCSKFENVEENEDENVDIEYLPVYIKDIEYLPVYIKDGQVASNQRTWPSKYANLIETRDGT